MFRSIQVQQSAAVVHVGSAAVNVPAPAADSLFQLCLCPLSELRPASNHTYQHVGHQPAPWPASLVLHPCWLAKNGLPSCQPATCLSWFCISWTSILSTSWGALAVTLLTLSCLGGTVKPLKESMVSMASSDVGCISYAAQELHPAWPTGSSVTGHLLCSPSVYTLTHSRRLSLKPAWSPAASWTAPADAHNLLVFS